MHPRDVAAYIREVGAGGPERFSGPPAIIESFGDNGISDDLMASHSDRPDLATDRPEMVQLPVPPPRRSVINRPVLTDQVASVVHVVRDGVDLGRRIVSLDGLEVELKQTEYARIMAIAVRAVKRHLQEKLNSALQGQGETGRVRSTVAKRAPRKQKTRNVPGVHSSSSVGEQD